jgi:hypothetical protein
MEQKKINYISVPTLFYNVYNKSTNLLYLKCLYFMLMANARYFAARKYSLFILLRSIVVCRSTGGLQAFDCL